MGTREDHGRSRNRVPAEKKLRIRIARERHRDEVIHFIRRVECATAVLWTVENPGLGALHVAHEGAGERSAASWPRCSTTSAA